MVTNVFNISQIKETLYEIQSYDQRLEVSPEYSGNLPLADKFSTVHKKYINDLQDIQEPKLKTSDAWLNGFMPLRYFFNFFCHILPEKPILGAS